MTKNGDRILNVGNQNMLPGRQPGNRHAANFICELQYKILANFNNTAIILITMIILVAIIVM